MDEMGRGSKCDAPIHSLDAGGRKAYLHAGDRLKDGVPPQKSLHEDEVVYAPSLCGLLATPKTALYRSAATPLFLIAPLQPLQNFLPSSE